LSRLKPTKEYKCLNIGLKFEQVYKYRQLVFAKAHLKAVLFLLPDQQSEFTSQMICGYLAVDSKHIRQDLKIQLFAGHYEL